MNTYKPAFIIFLFAVTIFYPLNGQSDISIDPDSLYSDLITGETETHTVTIANNGASVLHWEMEVDWVSMESVTFTKNDFADWQLPQNQDRVLDNLWITRCNTGATFDAYNEMCGWHPHGPDGTEWAIGSLEDIDNLTWNDFVMTLNHSVGSWINGQLIPNNQPMIMHVIEDDLYYEVQFHSWTEGGAGGGFSYTRTSEYRAISMSPVNGSVAADSSIEVEVIIDASGLPDGDYYADIVVTSNDPDDSEVVVPVHMSVTGAPDIWVDSDSLNFTVFMNYDGAGTYGGTVELKMGNDGTEDLNVSNITIDNAAFTVSDAWASLDVGEWIVMDVSFMTTDVGTYSATITIESDDPDEGTLTIPVHVDAIEPPVIDVSGNATVTLNVDETQNQTLTLANSGQSDLIYEIDLYEEVQQQGRRPNTRQASSQNKGTPVKGIFDITDPETRKNLHRSLQKLNNTENNSESEIANERYSRHSDRAWQLVYTDANEASLNIDVGNMYVDLDDEELLFKWESYVGWENTSGIATQFIYVDLDKDINTGAPMWEMVPSWNIGAEYQIQRFHDNWARVLESYWDPGYNDWLWFEVEGLTTNLVAPNSNEVIVGIDINLVEGSNGINFGMVVDNLNEPNVDLVPSYGTWNYIPFNFAPDWLSVDPLSGVVAADSSQDFTSYYDATGMLGGDYFADVIFYSNDPVNPAYTVSAHLDVTGIPDIYVQDEAVDFGISYAGYSDEVFLTLENTGNDILEVQNITTDSENLTVDETSFDIDALHSDSIQLSLTATDLGDFSANVTIESNDPDEPSITIPVTSTILIAPDISTTPETFDLTVEPGGTISDTLTIANVGGSDLDFEGEVSFTTIRDVTDIPFEITILTDNYPGETSWNLSTSAGQTIAAIVPGNLTSLGTLYSWEYELGPDDYVFTIYDAWGDGICCEYGNGEYNLYLDDQLIANGGEFGSNESVEFSIEIDAWLTMDPLSGIVSSDGSTDITLIVDASALEIGDHSADIYITSNDPDEGTVTIPLSLSVASMGSDDEALFPKEFALHQNYPNPFNPMTSIRYDLPKNENVKIIIYDMLGRQVRQLVDSYQEAGFKSIIWDATNDFGKPAAAGVYLYKIQTSDFIQTKKMVLLK